MDLTDLPSRFQTKIEERDTGYESLCWCWTGGLTGLSPSGGSGGYGQVWWEGRNCSAHRVVFTLAGGEIPDGFTLDHLCRRHECVRAEHLEPVTLTENTRRGTRFGDSCKRGHPYVGDNFYLRPRDGARMCRLCRRITDARLRESRKTY